VTTGIQVDTVIYTDKVSACQPIRPDLLGKIKKSESLDFRGLSDYIGQA
jgi:hypothetical protein